MKIAKTWYSLSTKVISSAIAVPPEKKPGRSITFTIGAVAGRHDGRLCQIITGVLELGARRLDLRLRDPQLRLSRGDLRLDSGYRREVAADPARQLFSDLLLGRTRRGNLRGELDDVRLRLLQIEAIPGAGRGEFRVLCHPFLGQFERGLQ